MKNVMLRSKLRLRGRKRKQNRFCQ